MAAFLATYGDVVTKVLIAAGGAFLGWLFGILAHWYKYRHARGFWRQMLSEDGLLVLSRFDDFPEFEPSGLVGAGDAHAVAELSTFARGALGSTFRIGYADHLASEQLTSNLVLVGGPDANKSTRELVDRIQHSMTPGDIDQREVQFSDQVSGKTYVPSLGGDGRRGVDYAYIVKARNPLNAKKEVLIISGCFGYGTWGAVRLAISDEFLALGAVRGGDDFEAVVRCEVVDASPVTFSLETIRPLVRSNAPKPS